MAKAVNHRTWGRVSTSSVLSCQICEYHVGHHGWDLGVRTPGPPDITPRKPGVL